jgi:hypothetical protein
MSATSCTWRGAITALSYTFVKLALQAADLVPKARGRGRPRRRREPRPCFGELLHLDGSVGEHACLVEELGHLESAEVFGQRVRGCSSDASEHGHGDVGPDHRGGLEGVLQTQMLDVALEVLRGRDELGFPSG